MPASAVVASAVAAPSHRADRRHDRPVAGAPGDAGEHRADAHRDAPRGASRRRSERQHRRHRDRGDQPGAGGDLGAVEAARPPGTRWPTASDRPTGRAGWRRRGRSRKRRAGDVGMQRADGAARADRAVGAEREPGREAAPQAPIAGAPLIQPISTSVRPAAGRARTRAAPSPPARRARRAARCRGRAWSPRSRGPRAAKNDRSADQRDLRGRACARRRARRARSVPASRARAGSTGVIAGSSAGISARIDRARGLEGRLEREIRRRRTGAAPVDRRRR